MIPILYESDETLFASNGLGRLRDCITCKVTEERNGVYECDFEYPVDGANYDQIRLGRIIAVEHDDTNDLQPFDIVSSTEPLDGIVTFHAVHISYRLTKAVAMGTNVTTLADAFTMLSSAQPSSIFTFWTDKTSSGFMSSADGTPRSVRQFLGGVEGSILDTYGGEYEWDKFTVKLWNARGTDRDFTIRYGVNLVDFNRETDCSETYNAVIPYWKSDTAMVIGDMVSVDQGERVDCVPLDLSEKFESQPTKAQVEAMAQSLLNSNQPYLPSQNIEVDFVRLQDSEEYSALANLYKCNLCDYIRVEFPKYNMSGRFKIVRTVYDVLLERYESMELGNLQTTLSEALGIGSDSSSSASVADKVIEQGTAGNWIYRKWNSGIAEAWRTYNKTSAQTTSSSGGYRSDTVDLGATPQINSTYLFTEMPKYTITAHSTATQIMLLNNAEGYSLSNLGKVCVWRGNSNSTSFTVYYDVYCIGKWK